MFEKRAVMFPIPIDWVIFFTAYYASIVNTTFIRQIKEKMYIVYILIHKIIFEILFSL